MPTLYLVAENDIFVPLVGIRELFERTGGTKRMVILRRADHGHFMDRVEEVHEDMCRMPWSGELAWVAEEIRPLAELCSGDQAHLFTRGLALCHLDATLKRLDEARKFLGGDIEAELATRGVDAIAG